MRRTGVSWRDPAAEVVAHAMARDEKLEQLKRVPLFSRLAGRELERLAMLADEIDVPAGQLLTREGASGHEFFIVIDGAVEIERQGERVATLRAGDFLGEIALIDGRPRTATARAVGPTRLLVVGHAAFHDLLEQFPEVARSVLSALAERVRHNEERDERRGAVEV
jgi:CRP-like cAMP-binding protein